MKKKLFETPELWALTVLRVFLGTVVFAHGAQKLFGLFGGFGFTGTMQFFTETVGLPWLIGLLVIILESVGAIALILGITTRLIAISYIFIGIGIVLTTHLPNGFFMNWFNNQPGEGWEYFILWVGMAMALSIAGGGKYSVDRIIAPTV